MKNNVVTTDLRGRVSLAAYVGKDQHYQVNVSPDGVVTLTPVTVYTRDELAAEIGHEAADAVFDNPYREESK